MGRSCAAEEVRMLGARLSENFHLAGALQRLGVRIVMQQEAAGLALPELRIEAALVEQLVMRALLDDATVLKHVDAVGIADGAETVGDDEAGAVRHEVLQRLLNLAFGFGVHAGGGFIKEEDWRIAQQGTGVFAIQFVLGGARQRDIARQLPDRAAVGGSIDEPGCPGAHVDIVGNAAAPYLFELLEDIEVDTLLVHDVAAGVRAADDGAAERVQTLVQTHKSLLANASHELRSPLARLRMAVELLAEAAPQQRALASEAGRDIEELDALVGDLLLASRLEARPPVREPVDLAALVAEEAQRAGAKDMSSGPAPYAGDPAALRRLLRNLFENAARHGRPPVEARVEARAGGLWICVDDRGAGVPEAERERIFAAFYRPAGHREGDGGVGLGLALVRQIAERHGGTVRCEARPGGGSRFVVELPA